MKRILVGILLMVSCLWMNAQILSDSNLPIVVIETDNGMSIPDEPKIPASMKIIWHQDGSRNYLTDINNPEFLNYNGRIGIERRGSSSQMLPKKPYGLTTLKDDDITPNNVSLLGMPKENDWVLNSLAFDETGLRDVLSYELSEQLGQYAPRRVYCEVMINGDYKGLYVFLEKIKVDDNRVNIMKMDETSNAYPEVTGGYITKADKNENGDPVAWVMTGYGGSGWWWSTICTDFIHHYPKPENITMAQNDYIYDIFQQFASVAHQHNTDIVTGIPSVIDIPSFIDFMMIGEFSSNVDVYQYSTFFHKDRKGKLRAGPVWDYNLTFGHDEFGNRSKYNVWQFDNDDNNGPTFWKDLFDTDLFKCYFAKRWNELIMPGQPLNYDVLCNRIDEIHEWILEGIGRDNQRWNKMTNHVREVQLMKTWISNRIDWISQNVESYSGCTDVDLPPLVISKINYHPKDWLGIDGNHLEFIEITNNGNQTVDLTGVYFRELGVTYSFPVGSSLEPQEAIMLCSDSLVFKECYGGTPFDQFERNLSNKSEYLVLVDAWGNVIDEVRYFDSDPWPEDADGKGAYLQLIDLNLDNNLPESWTVGFDITSVSEIGEFSIYPNPAKGSIRIDTGLGLSLIQTKTDYRITNIMGQVLMTGMICGESKQIDVSQLSVGLYFITVGEITQKLVISK